MTDQFEYILKEDTVPETAVENEKEEHRSESAYVLIKTKSNEDLFETYRKLYFFMFILPGTI